MTPEDVLTFWFEGDPTVWRGERWFGVDPAFDREITERFGFTLEAARDGVLDPWAADPRDALALVIVLDQFGRNIHRGSHLAYAGDAHARRIAAASIERGDDLSLTPVQRVFLYLPYEHSESRADQVTSVALFERLRRFPEVAEAVAYAGRQRDIISRFGRYPHRNAILGRTSTPEELAFLENPDAPPPKKGPWG
jgi:uncharacterized protein (DUF924 family)